MRISHPFTSGDLTLHHRAGGAGEFITCGVINGCVTAVVEDIACPDCRSILAHRESAMTPLPEGSLVRIGNHIFVRLNRNPEWPWESDSVKTIYSDGGVEHELGAGNARVLREGFGSDVRDQGERSMGVKVSE